MNDLKRQLAEDRELRTAARSIIFDQFLRVREATSGRKIGTQLANRLGDDAFDLAERAAGAARGKGGLTAAIAGIAAAAAALWFLREPIAELLGRNGDPAEDESEPPEARDDELLENELQAETMS